MKKIFLLLLCLYCTLSFAKKNVLLCDFFSADTSRIDSIKKQRPRILLYYEIISGGSYNTPNMTWSGTASGTASSGWQTISYGPTRNYRGYIVGDSIHTIIPVSKGNKNILEYIKKDSEALVLHYKAVRQHNIGGTLLCASLATFFIEAGLGNYYSSHQGKAYIPVISVGVVGISCIAIGTTLFNRSSKTFTQSVKTYNKNAGYGEIYGISAKGIDYR